MELKQTSLYIDKDLLKESKIMAREKYKTNLSMLMNIQLEKLLKQYKKELNNG